jgi:hypothetical protein
LRRVNGLPADKEENQIAIKMAASLDVADGQGGETVTRAKRVVAVSARPDPLGAPVPPQRLASAGNLASVSAPSSAPHSSPAAPRRP